MYLKETPSTKIRTNGRKLPCACALLYDADLYNCIGIAIHTHTAAHRAQYNIWYCDRFWAFAS
eukprot:2316940-Rhodomonas_salina.2